MRWRPLRANIGKHPDGQCADQDCFKGCIWPTDVLLLLRNHCLILQKTHKCLSVEDRISSCFAGTCIKIKSCFLCGSLSPLGKKPCKLLVSVIHCVSFAGKPTIRIQDDGLQEFHHYQERSECFTWFFFPLNVISPSLSVRICFESKASACTKSYQPQTVPEKA